MGTSRARLRHDRLEVRVAAKRSEEWTSLGHVRPYRHCRPGWSPSQNAPRLTYRQEGLEARVDVAHRLQMRGLQERLTNCDTGLAGLRGEPYVPGLTLEYGFRSGAFPCPSPAR